MFATLSLTSLVLTPSQLKMRDFGCSVFGSIIEVLIYLT